MVSGKDTVFCLPNTTFSSQKITNGTKMNCRPRLDEPKRFSLHRYAKRKGERGSILCSMPECFAYVLFPWARSCWRLFCLKSVYLSSTVMYVCARVLAKLYCKMTSPPPRGSEITKENDTERIIHNSKNDSCAHVLHT